MSARVPTPLADHPGEQSPASRTAGTGLRSPYVLLAVGLVIVLIGVALQTAGIASVGILTIILAAGIILLSDANPG